MKWLIPAFLVLSVTTNAQLISGYVLDKATGESIIGATVSDLNSRNAVFTNNYGFYSIQVLSFPAELKVTSVGYKSPKFNYLDYD